MFDTIGRRRSDERRLVPFVLSLLMNGSVVGGLVLIGAHKIQDVVADVPTAIVYYADAPRAEMPNAAPAAAPAGPATKRAAAKRAPTVESDKPSAVASEAAPETGLEDITGVAIDATTGGAGDGGIPGGMGSSGGGPRSVHWTDVTVKVRAKPKMPEAARVLSFTEESCNVRFFIDEKGKPYDIRLEDCPTIFHDSALEAAWQWRFYPYRDHGVPTKAQFVLSIIYKLR
jgi:hypothetical protein